MDLVVVFETKVSDAYYILERELDDLKLTRRCS